MKRWIRAVWSLVVEGVQHQADAIIARRDEPEPDSSPFRKPRVVEMYPMDDEQAEACRRVADDG